MTPLAHRCIYRPSQAVDYFWAVLLLQPGLVTQILPRCLARVCVYEQQGCLQSIRANAVVAYKAGTVNFPLPLDCAFPVGTPLQVTCTEGAELWAGWRAAGVEHCASS